MALTHSENRDRSANPQSSFGANNVGPFSHQLPGFPVQNPYQMQQWGQQFLNASMYNRYDPAATATANRSPMNMGGWYPPATYSTSPAFNQASGNTSFRGAYPATSGGNPYAASTAVAAGAYSSSFGAQAGYTSSAATGGAPPFGLDPSMTAGMASMNLAGAGSPAGNNNSNIDSGNAGANGGSNTN